jgi:MFS family permease
VSHPLIITLKNLRGNARGCVYTEPLWGIPYGLFIPYVSVYMLALGLDDRQIGLITSIGLACQVFWTLMSGAVTDKLGRKRATLITDLIAWSIACLIWAFAQNFAWFLAGAIINSVGRITHNSWHCLLVEDTDPELLIDIYSWIYIAALIAAFFSPLAGLLISRYSLAPTMRGLYLFAFVGMTAKFLISNALVTETRQGLIRMRETARQSLFVILGGYRGVLGQLLRAPKTLFAGALLLVLGIGATVSGAFWGILVTEKLRIPAQHLVLFTFSRSMVVLFFYFAVMPRLKRLDVRTPMVFGFAGMVLAHTILISVPAGNYVLLLLATLLEGASAPTITALLDTLVVRSVAPQERARTMSILWVLIILFTSPFGWIAGQLSALNRSWPFVLNIFLYIIGGLLVYRASRSSSERVAVGG